MSPSKVGARAADLTGPKDAVQRAWWVLSPALAEAVLYAHGDLNGRSLAILGGCHAMRRTLASMLLVALFVLSAISAVSQMAQDPNGASEPTLSRRKVTVAKQPAPS